MKLTKAPKIECQCSICQGYCRHAPGWFLPGEIEKAAELLGMTKQEFFNKHCSVDFWAGDLVWVLRPASVNDTPGAVVPYDPRGACRFFLDGKCGIHAAKPHECATVSHHRDPPPDWHKLHADAWRDHQDEIRELLGYEPQEPEPHSLGTSNLFGGWL